jgi:hypothetical protein
MRRARLWLIGIAFVGIAATIIAGGLLWLLLTQPVAVVAALGRGL